MKKFNMKKTTAAAVAATVGAVLLLGGAGTLAYWSDTETSATQTISSGNLNLDSIATGSWKLQQFADGQKTTLVDYVAPAAGTPTKPATPIVPGDVLTATVDVPVALAGTNMKARLDVANPVVVVPAGSDAKLQEALVVSVVSVDGTAGATKTFSGTKTGTVPVVITVTFPWTTDTATPVASNTVATALHSVTFSAKYTLTQVTAGTTPIVAP